MTYKTHFIGGACAPIMLSAVMPIENIAVVAGVSAFSALLPDIDIEGSKVHNKAGIVGKGVTSIFSHRGFIHTPILYVVLYALMSMVLPQAICLGFLIGTISHLVLDTFNYKGIMWMYPFSRKHFHIASIKTRTTMETIFMAVMIAITLFVLVNNGLMPSIDVNEAMSQFNFEMPTIEFPKFDFSNFEVSTYDWNTAIDKCENFIIELRDKVI
jgi:inner membrane protein